MTTNNLVLATGQQAVPAFMQQYAQQSTMGTFGDAISGGRRVQVKGGQINFLGENGEPMGVRADGGVTVDFPRYAVSADIIIVGIMPAGNTNYRAWYAEKYVEGSSAPPACWSADGVHPSDKSHKKQSDACATCAKNVSGTSETGKGKACSSRKKLAVVYAHDPLLRVFSLDLSGTALYGKSAREVDMYFTLAEYAKHLKQGGAIWEGIVTEMHFAEGSNIGVRFKAKSYVDADTFNRVMALHGTDDVNKALLVDFPAYKEPEAAATAAAAPDQKSMMLANPAFQTTLAFLREWAAHPSITADAIRAEAAKYGVNL